MKLALALAAVAVAAYAHGVHHDTWTGLETVLSEKTSAFALSSVYNVLFPFGPAGNALLATTYISGPPNLVLGLIPGDINMGSLGMLVSFAVGGLLGDVFLHLLPQTFAGQKVDVVVNGANYTLVDEDRALVLGLALFAGFFLFFLIDKLLRVLQHQEAMGKEGEKSHTQSQSHSHSHSHSNTQPDAASSVKPSVYLNLISDFAHNITDGLAIASSFYISKNVGATTAIATFMHEIPHEVGDFALLIQGGLSKWQAMGSQFGTALGAYAGTLIGIALQEGLAQAPHGATGAAATSTTLWGNLSPADLTLPFTAGGFLYISFSVLPELLEGNPLASRRGELVRLCGQVFWLCVGIALMAAIALSE